MKMIFGIAFVLALVGCGDGYDSSKCQQAVTEQLKGWEVVCCPSAYYCFVARDPEGNIWWIETMSNKAEITSKFILIPKH